MKKLSLFLGICFTIMSVCAKTINGPVSDFFDKEWKFEKSKKITQNFTVKQDALLNIQNKYGDVNIVPWDSKEIDFEIIVKVKSNKEDIANNMLELINVEFSNQNNTVSAKTVISSHNFKNKNVNYNIRYDVKVPRFVYMDLKNKYGNVNLQTVSKKLKAEVEYGNFRADSLLAESLLDLEYGNANIVYAANTEFDVEYGNIEIENAIYSDIEIGYGNLEIDNVKTLLVSMKYGGIRIKNLTSMIRAELEYSRIKIKDINKGFKSVYIASDYGSVSVGASSESSFQYDLESSYGEIDTEDFNLSHTTMIERDLGTHLIGNYGDTPSQSSIKIRSSYASIELTKSNFFDR